MFFFDIFDLRSSATSWPGAVGARRSGCAATLEVRDCDRCSTLTSCAAPQASAELAENEPGGFGQHCMHHPAP